MFRQEVCFSVFDSIRIFTEKSVGDTNHNRKKEERKMKKLIQFFKEEDGATAVEYALFVALIAALIVVAVQSIGQKSQTAFQSVDTAMP